MIRIFDLILSGIGLLVLLPILSPVCVVLRFTGEGEIFYKQERVGLNGKTFKLLKFATMLKNSPKLGAGEITIKDDPRVLPIGKFLRKSKINELPQLWNIFVGEMSIVGPRPLVEKTYRKYSEKVKFSISKVRPGLTGIGSIVFRDEEKLLNNLEDPILFYDTHISPYKGELEIWFVENNSLSVYFKIIFLTAWVIIFPSSKIVGRQFPSIPPLPDFINPQ